MNTTIIAIHGHGLKPERDVLDDLWREALTHGVRRHQKNALKTFEAARWEFVYFNDLTEPFLAGNGETLDSTLDHADRRHSFEQLKSRKKKSFTSRRVYERLPGQSALGEFIADVGQPLLRSVGLGRLLIDQYAPSYIEYWENQRASVLARATAALQAAMERGDRITVLAHCLGSVVAYDAFWTLQHDPSFERFRDRKVHHWITMGSPLGDETVKRHLLGADRPLLERYPHNVLHWTNVHAEDDYIAHDNTVANDFQPMLAQRLISTIEDTEILNLAVRYGRSNPHNAVGYLVSPSVARAVCAALTPP